MNHVLISRCAIVAVSSLLLIGCGSTQTRSDPSQQPASAPVFASSATIHAGGLGCPMCAESIDILLKNIEGVIGSDVDLSSGMVHVQLDPAIGVSPSDLQSAIIDGGFTFHRVEFAGDN